MKSRSRSAERNREPIVTRLALEAGFERERVVVRPANNHVIVFRLR